MLFSSCSALVQAQASKYRCSNAFKRCKSSGFSLSRTSRKTCAGLVSGPWPSNALCAPRSQSHALKNTTGAGVSCKALALARVVATTADSKEPVPE
eukprot:11720690-Alexandrium_andersonii.AAC.1